MIRGADPIAVKDHPSTVPVRDCRAFAVQPFGRCRVTFHYAEGDCPIYEEFTFNDAGEMTFVEAWSDRPGLLPTTDPNDAWAEGKGAEPVHRLSTRIPGLGTPTGQFDPTAPSTTAAATADAEVADFVDRTQDFVSYYLAEYKAVGKDVYKRGCGW